MGNCSFRRIERQRLYITGTPARHGPVGIEPIAGEVTGFLLGLNEPGDAIYVTGDTVWYEGVAEVARRFRSALVMLFAGSAKPRGPFHVTMDNNDAIETPMHLGRRRLWPFITRVGDISPRARPMSSGRSEHWV
jgi:hypothetical protein